MYAPTSSAPFSRSALNPPVRFVPPCTAPAILKQEPGDAEPILIGSNSPSPEPRSSVESRNRLFTSLELGDHIFRNPRSITTPDDLDDSELKRCFDILHACSLATEFNATLSNTKDTMEDFLTAIFKNWTGDAGEPDKPTMDFVVREYISVGNICSKRHASPPIIEPAPHAPNHHPAAPQSLESPYIEVDQLNSASVSPRQSRSKVQAKMHRTSSVRWSALM
ncbi:hypothetical protein FOXB_05800 [Fusarium oxysporum f. sp. conglutinans Fo5176]|uniref:Uncharacterized protein n=1 Tax=Fusarium oxysporum (strain Fo5176) TaxID=660025 RepID=F9FHC1_FUSOF|nr:hypothetical protein FOXB_05800 [Fusarium oxysporum f. sp. conglutinans Fo5176]